jgi:hypothetical protein
MELRFTSIGKVPRVVRTDVYVFHDAAGTIHHVHEHIVLEGAKSRPVEAMLEEVRAHAASHRNDLGKLKMLHVQHALEPDMEHRVDVKRGEVVSRPIPPHPPLKRVAGAGKVRKTRRKARPQR